MPLFTVLSKTNNHFGSEMSSMQSKPDSVQVVALHDEWIIRLLVGQGLCT